MPGFATGGFIDAHSDILLTAAEEDNRPRSKVVTLCGGQHRLLKSGALPALFVVGTSRHRGGFVAPVR